MFASWVLLLAAFSTIESFKILILLPFPGPSHILMFETFVKEFIARGHEVTAITALPFKEKMKNFTEVLIEPTWSFGDGCEYCSKPHSSH